MGAYVGFYLGSKSTGAAFKLGLQAAGEVEWNLANAMAAGSSASADQITNATPGAICSMAISYDDKLGLRIFAGNVQPMAGVTVCP